MNEFKDLMYCPSCDIYYKKGSWLCEFCNRNVVLLEWWEIKTDAGKKKWLESHKPMFPSVSDEKLSELPEDSRNFIIEKRKSAHDFDSRYRAYLADMAAPHTPKCPVCGSPDLQKISTTSKVLDVAFWGFASGKARKVYHCNNCDYEF